MERIGNWPITEADTDFFKPQKMDQKIGTHWRPLLLLLVVSLLFSRPESLIWHFLNRIRVSKTEEVVLNQEKTF
jgi:hypothetical protein